MCQDHARNRSSRDYFILKSIIVHNLYGVDIMEEAVEICKLRLFLKLVSQVERVDQLEPLPDIDFNVRAGNTLIGFATLADVKNAFKGTLAFGKDEVDRIVEEAEIVDRAFEKFHEMQTNFGLPGTAFAECKRELRERLDRLTSELDAFLAGQYGIDTNKPNLLEAWRKSHQPFHWFAEFFGIMRRGGFDVIIGNPPYVEIPQTYSRVALRQLYRTALDRWSRDEDLYTLVVERSFQTISKQSGRYGMILPLSIAFSTKRPFQILRAHIARMPCEWWWSHFDRIPSALFGNEVRTRCTIAISGPLGRTKSARHTTALSRWATETRESLFPCLRYASFPTDTTIEGGIPEVGSQLQADALIEILGRAIPLEAALSDSIPFSRLASVAPKFPSQCVYVGGTAYNWFPVWREIPETSDVHGNPSLPARTAGFQFQSDDEADVVFALLASSLGYWWWAVASDGFNLKKWLLDRFPLGLEALGPQARKELSALGSELRSELRAHYVYKDNRGRIGNFFLPACSDLCAQVDACLSKHLPSLSAEFFEDVRDFNRGFSRSIVEESSGEDDA